MGDLAGRSDPVKVVLQIQLELQRRNPLHLAAVGGLYRVVERRLGDPDFLTIYTSRFVIVLSNVKEGITTRGN